MLGMRVVRSEAELGAALKTARGARESLGFVPTMGALHAGHIALVERARGENEVCAASIFVNPLQFAPSEDLSAYPRTEEADLALLSAAGTDVVLIGRSEDLYPPGFATTVDVARVTEGGEGAQRPTHFRGVATVVAKLFGMFQPTRAYFGWKDMQQCCVIKRMVRDLSLSVTIVPCETVREADGLACSSRNRYLDREQRAKAPCIHRALCAARELFRAGERRHAAFERLVRSHLEPDFVVDYLEVRDEEDFARSADPVTGGRLVIAARLGRTRLLDNLPLAP
jgi:pantoate--beta-alanine ligase